jgi:hypothetical protein
MLVIALCAMAQAVSRRPLAAEARVRAQVSPCGVGGRQSGTEIGFSPNSVFPFNFIPLCPSTLTDLYHLQYEQ